MILVTVGTELPFDRLIAAIDTWADTHQDVEIHAQIGNSSYTSRNFPTYRFLDSESYNAFLSRCELIVAHAGMGVILNALTEQKPIIVMPRLCAFREHRNDHQLATAEAFQTRGFVRVAADAPQLHSLLADHSSYVQEHSIPRYASSILIEAVYDYIHVGR